MAYDLEEQEQIANLQAFWNRYGTLIYWVIIVGCASYAAWNYYGTYKRNQAEKDAAQYEQLLDVAAAGDNAKVQGYAAALEGRSFARTAYAQMAALAAAKSAFVANDLKTAKAQLQWAIDHGDDEYQSVARLRLSGVLLDEKAYDEALKVVDTGVLPQFAAEVQDRKGDVLVAQNKLPEARAAYQAALDKMGAKHPGRQLVQVKLDAIGGAPAAAPAAPKAPA